MKNLKGFFKSKNFQILRFVLLIFLCWRIVITLISFFGLGVFPSVFPDGKLGWADPDTGYWIKWANWDGGHFRGIAENGYLHPFQVVFFPLYPLLIKGLMLAGLTSLWGGLLISNLAIIGALYYLYKLTILDFEDATARKVILVTLAFPTAFYFGAVYSESLFLFPVIAAFYYSRVKNWFAAFLFAGLCAAIRLSGLAVILAIGLEYYLKTPQPLKFKEFWSSFSIRLSFYLGFFALIFKLISKFYVQKNDYFTLGILKSLGTTLNVFSFTLILLFLAGFLVKKINFQKIFTVPALFGLLSLLPFLGYCYFLYNTQGNYFAFINHETQWQRHLTLPWNAPLIYFKNLLFAGFFRIDATQQLIEFLFFSIFFVLLIISALKLRISYTIFFVFSLLLPVSTGTLQAIHRYGLVIFPAMILLAKIKNGSYFYMWLYFSLMLQGILLVLFFNSYWVS